MVVLPAPLGPRNPATLALLDGEAEVVDRGQAAESFGQAVDFDHRHGDRPVHVAGSDGLVHDLDAAGAGGLMSSGEERLIPCVDWRTGGSRLRREAQPKCRGGTMRRCGRPVR